MKKRFLSAGDWLALVFDTIVVCVVANSMLLAKTKVSGIIGGLILAAIIFLMINIVPSIFQRKIASGKIKKCAKGCMLLLVFSFSLILEILGLIIGLTTGVYEELLPNAVSWILYVLFVIAIACIVFWNGMIRVYLTSSQLGMKWRVIGAICGWMPVVHLVVLGKILVIATNEVVVEHNKVLLNQGRKMEQICKTKYPILMVHGVFFRDFRYFNYWGRIPEQLEQNGATIYYGNHQSALSVADSGQELADRIRQIVAETGCEKVNVIAHSKGGLDTRYAIAQCGVAPLVASLTTINTPHRGCEFAEYLLNKVPQKEKDVIANTYNNALRKLGDSNPDFIGAVTDLTASACAQINQIALDSPQVYYQSVGSTMRVARGGRFPLNLSHHLVHHFDGANDGLVGEASFPWGSNFQMLSVTDNRGISHGDMIDLNRENLPQFDVREFFVQLVATLKQKGF